MDFFDLEPARILSAVESLGYSCSGHIQQLNSLENRVFDLRLDDGSHLIAKFYRPGRWSREAISEEHLFTSVLEQAEIPVCSAISIDGNQVFELRDSDSRQDACYFSIWHRVGGRLIDEFSSEILSRIGGYLGRIHQAGSQVRLPNRPVMDAQYMVLRHRDFLTSAPSASQAATGTGIPDKFREQYLESSYYLEKSAINMSLGLDFQAIHGDCHTGNMLLGDEGLFFLDFDDAMTGPPLQDLWMVVSDSPEAQNRKTDSFLEGYSRFHTFPVESLQFRELMRALRYLAYNGWIARRQEDPAIRRAFPDFGSDEYWEGFVIDLREQIERIEKDSGYQAGGQKAPEIPRTADEATELEDEDYFFDLDEGRWSPGD